MVVLFCFNHYFPGSFHHRVLQFHHLCALLLGRHAVHHQIHCPLLGLLSRYLTYREFERCWKYFHWTGTFVFISFIMFESFT